MDENEKMVKELAKLQYLYIRWIERHKFKFDNFYKTYKEVNEELKKEDTTITTYKNTVEILKKLIKKNCENYYILGSIIKLEKKIKESEIANLRLGLNDGTFTSLEVTLDAILFISQLFMNMNMVEIKFVVENFGLAKNTIKRACQQERLLNTKRIENNWIVHIPEVKTYWNILDDDKNNLYYR